MPIRAQDARSARRASFRPPGASKRSLIGWKPVRLLGIEAMRNGFLGPLALILAAAGLASAQAPAPGGPVPPPSPYAGASPGGLPSVSPLPDPHAGPPAEPEESL